MRAFEVKLKPIRMVRKIVFLTASHHFSCYNSWSCGKTWYKNHVFLEIKFALLNLKIPCVVWNLFLMKQCNHV